MQYPNYSLISYTQVELRWSKFSELLLPLGLGKDLINQIISCFAITTQAYRKGQSRWCKRQSFTRPR